MNQHHIGEQPEWTGLKPAKMNGWQRLAKQTSGLLTPANIITIAGLILVIIGLHIVATKDYTTGLIVVAIGRAFDILDGIVAEATHTKSPLGAFMDVTADKITSVVAIFVLAAIAVIHWWVAILILAENLINVVLSFIAKFRHVEPRPSKDGKLFMAYSWVSLAVFIFIASLSRGDHNFLKLVAYVSLAISAVYEIKAAAGYWRDTQSK